MTPISFLCGSGLYCPLCGCFWLSPLPALLPKLLRYPEMGTGGQTARLEIEETSTCPLGESGHGKGGSAQEESWSGCGAGSPGFCLGPAARSLCVICQFPPLSGPQCPPQGQSAGSPGFLPVLRNLQAFDIQVPSGHSNRVGWLGVGISPTFSSLGFAGIDCAERLADRLWTRRRLWFPTERASCSWDRRQVKGH